MTYDPKVYDLALMFVQDHYADLRGSKGVGREQIERQAHMLAEDIARTIEDFFEFSHNRIFE